MSDDRNSGTSGIILSFMLGGLTGAALAILFAPRSGKETRDLLNEKIRDGKERSRELRDKAASKGREILEDATDYVDRAKEGAAQRKDRLSAAIEAGRQAYRDEKEKM